MTDRGLKDRSSIPERDRISNWSLFHHCVQPSTGFSDISSQGMQPDLRIYLHVVPWLRKQGTSHSLPHSFSWSGASSQGQVLPLFVLKFIIWTWFLGYRSRDFFVLKFLEIKESIILHPVQRYRSRLCAFLSVSVVTRILLQHRITEQCACSKQAKNS